MGTNLRFVVCYLSLAIAAVSPSRVSAAEPQTSSHPAGSGHQSLVQLSGNIPWDAIVWVERRYKIETLRFKARDESGIDWLGSDEVTVGTFDSKGFTISRTIENIDSGDTHEFDPAKSCIVPIPPGEVVLGETSVCDPIGESAPLSFKVELWEEDQVWIEFNPHPYTPPGGHGSGNLYLHGDSDDFLGRAQIDLAALDLETALPNVGDVYDETVRLFPCEEEVCGVGPDAPDYTFTYRITRLPDVRVDLRSEARAAMQQSGIGSELEAVVAGLRSLRAPSSRQIEPKIGEPKTIR